MCNGRREFALHPAEPGGMRITDINTLSPEGPLLIHKLIPLNDGVLLALARGPQPGPRNLTLKSS